MWYEDTRSEWEKFCDLLWDFLAKFLFYAMMYGMVLTLPLWLWVTRLIWGRAHESNRSNRRRDAQTA